MNNMLNRYSLLIKLIHILNNLSDASLKRPYIRGQIPRILNQLYVRDVDYVHSRI
jgi:hypothetical protein